MIRYRAVPLLWLAVLLLPAAARAQVAGAWNNVEQLRPGTLVRLQTDHGKTSCSVDSVSREQITCGKQSFAATAVQSVRVERKGRSIGIGALIGGGVGAGVGAGVGSAIKGSFLVSSNGKAAGVGAALFGIVGAGVGALVGHGSGLGSTTVYRR